MSALTLYTRPLARLLDDDFGNLLDGFFPRSYAPSFSPSVEVTENDKAFTLHVEAPGMKKEEIHVEAKDGSLRIWGEKKSERNEKKENCTYSERSYGRFERSFRLPENVDVTKIDAHYRDGVLELALPKTEEAKPKQIEIKVN